MAKAPRNRAANQPSADARFSHVDADGTVRMVDVGDKPVTSREAIARGRITMSREAIVDSLGRAQERGSAADGAARRIMAAKQTAT